MSIELKRLIEKVAHMDITLLAGERGLSNDVTWIHMVESSLATSFLDGGEIAFVTGVAIGTSDELLDLVRSICEKNAAGIILNTGPYLDHVPQNVIEYCNQHDLPLFEVPWKIHLAEIMRIFSYTITKQDLRDTEISAVFRNAIFFPEQRDLYMIPLAHLPFQPEWKYTVCAVSPANREKYAESTLEQKASTVFGNLSHKYSDFSVFQSETQILAVLGNYSTKQVHSFVEDMGHYLKLAFPQSDSFLWGVGKTTKSIRCLYKSYRQAIAVQKLQSKGKLRPEQIFYSEMGLYKLLMNIDDEDIISDYLQNTVQPIINYDRDNNTDLMGVLRAYLENDGSVKETAQKLFVHRNTINYYLGKIKDLTGMDLSSLNVKTQLTTALMLMNIE
ncbi:MAG: PucR family transcriptional regulator ligand-binding domain-containing protein [Bilifractor sp.]|nr:PucR family transcriptional regulator ligand-binding domain-containing protein [Lachnospiraceae bacterium]MDY2836729.1 PucR family transcriptional regulator ligand-binding domain-containing protein [Bilifractor sp.]